MGREEHRPCDADCAADGDESEVSRISRSREEDESVHRWKAFCCAFHLLLSFRSCQRSQRMQIFADDFYKKNGRRPKPADIKSCKSVRQTPPLPAWSKHGCVASHENLHPQVCVPCL